MSDPKRPVEEVSADLPYELQFHSFQQLTNLATAGIGLSVTLAGSLLKTFNFGIWSSIAYFGVSALIALGSQFGLVQALHDRADKLKVMRSLSIVSMVFLGMGVGALAMAFALK
jgi:hypothetical protein